jgi:hypothetical protein
VVGSSLGRIARQPPPPIQLWSFYTASQDVSSNCAPETRILRLWKPFARDSAFSADKPRETPTGCCRWWDTECTPARSVA